MMDAAASRMVGASVDFVGSESTLLINAFVTRVDHMQTLQIIKLWRYVLVAHARMRFVCNYN